MLPVEKKEICDGSYYTKAGSIAFHVEVPLLPETIQVHGHTLLKRSTFHVTILGVNKIIQQYGISNVEFANDVVDDLCNFVRTRKIAFEAFTHELRFVQEHERKTVIAMCTVSHLNEFIDFVNKKYALSIEHPPAHVTLYTLQQDAGIFVIDAKELKMLTSPIDNPGIQL